MRAIANQRIRAWLALAVASAGLALTGSTASAAPVTIDLCAKAGSLYPLPTTSQTLSIPIWGFGVPSTPGDCSTAIASLPGPVRTVNEGDLVTINVTNALPAGHTISFEIPGVSFEVGPTDADVGETVTRSFTASAPGTYLYQSGGDGGRQAAMGLYGALIVRSATAGRAYDDTTTAYAIEQTLVLSQIDPNFNNAPDSYDMYRYRATYWLINGKAYPDAESISDAGGTKGKKVLLRYLNAGYDNTTLLLLGVHERVIARDARLLNNPFDADAETIPAGGTEDAIVTVPAFGAPSSQGFPLYNRQLHVTNGAATDPLHIPGGMLTFIVP